MLAYKQIMRRRQSLQALCESILKFINRIGRAPDLAGYRLDNRKQIFGTMRDFVHEELNVILGGLAIGDIHDDVDQPLSFATQTSRDHLAAAR
jgi:hypothetical protein